MRYPPNGLLPCSNVADYCFPEGVETSPLDIGESLSDLNKVLYAPGTCQRGDNSFTFMFSGDHGFRGGGEAVAPRIYGICVSFPRVHYGRPTPS
ncbi:unnamed protein product, partial [Choristocarpus tenellus]